MLHQRLARVDMGAFESVGRAMRDRGESERAADPAVLPTPVAELIRRVEEAMAARVWVGRQSNGEETGQHSKGSPKSLI